MHDYFRPALVALVEMLVCSGCLIQRKLVRYDHGRIRFSVMNQVHEAAVIRLHVALTRAHLLAFEPELTEVKGNLADFG